MAFTSHTAWHISYGLCVPRLLLIHLTSARARAKATVRARARAGAGARAGARARARAGARAWAGASLLLIHLGVEGVVDVAQFAQQLVVLCLVALCPVPSRAYVPCVHGGMHAFMHACMRASVA